MNFTDKYDVVVVGAGIAGIGAAVKAGRLGAKTLLIEHYSFVGGMSTAGMVSPFMKHAIDGDPLVQGVFQDIEEEMIKHHGMIDNGFYAANFRTAANHLLKEAGVEVLTHAEVTEVVKNGRVIEAVKVLFQGQTLTIEGHAFVDTSGDAQLVYLGDFPWAKGDEKTGHTQALTLFFRMGGIDVEKAVAYAKDHPENFLPWVDFELDEKKIYSIAGWTNFVEKAKSEGRVPEDVEYVFFTSLPESGEGSFNSSNVLGVDASTSEGLTKAELQGREQVNKLVKMLMEEVPGFEEAYLMETAVQIGVRETRRAMGDYLVTGSDISSGRKFDDAIARACYGIDIHGQKDEESRMEYLKEGEYYEVPLRSLMVDQADNLLVAGRCVSSTREGQSALRIMPTCCAMGEAAGTLASLSAKANTDVRSIKAESVRKEITYNLGI